MKGKDLYDLYSEVHAAKSRKFDTHTSTHFNPETAVAWPYLPQTEKNIWDEVGKRLGTRRVTK